MLEKIKLMVFDLDGTLAHTLPDLTSAMNRTVSRYGAHTVPEQMMRACIGNGLRKLIERIYIRLNLPMDAIEQDFLEFKADYSAHCCEHTVLYPETIETLRKAKQRGMHLAVATMKSREASLYVLQKLEIIAYFECVITADDMVFPKPDAWSVRECARICGVPPAQTAVVGDGMTDVGMAKNAGATAIALLDGYGNTDDLLASSADYKLKNISELKDIL